MNENTHLLSALYIISSQLQNIKEKIDPEVYELLQQSGHEAISSAHHFLDACEKALDSFVETSTSTSGDTNNDQNEDSIDLDKETIDNIVELNIAEG